MNELYSRTTANISYKKKASLQQSSIFQEHFKMQKAWGSFFHSTRSWVHCLISRQVGIWQHSYINNLQLNQLGIIIIMTIINYENNSCWSYYIILIQQSNLVLVNEVQYSDFDVNAFYLSLNFHTKSSFNMWPIKVNVTKYWVYVHISNRGNTSYT